MLFRGIAMRKVVPNTCEIRIRAEISVGFCLLARQRAVFLRIRVEFSEIGGVLIGGCSKYIY